MEVLHSRSSLRLLCKKLADGDAHAGTDAPVLNGVVDGPEIAHCRQPGERRSMMALVKVDHHLLQRCVRFYGPMQSAAEAPPERTMVASAGQLGFDGAAIHG